MSNYPDLPIITDESGFEYAEGLNLFVNAGKYTASSPYTVTSNKVDNCIDRFNNGKAIYTSVPFKTGQKITLQAKSNLPWSGVHLNGVTNKAGFWLYWGSKQNAMEGTYVKPQFIAGDNATNFVKTIKVPEVSGVTELYCCFRFNTYSDGSTNLTGKFWDLMLEFGDKKHDYRPKVSGVTELYCCFRFNTYSDGSTNLTGKFWDLMLEFGDKKHDYRPNPADVSGVTELYCCFRFNTYSDGSTNLTGKFWDLMLEFGDKKHDYRPNPADLVGGGGTNGYCS